MKLSLGCVTDKGKFRSKNQDRIMCKRKILENHTIAVACVCDGIGSFSESEIASQMMINGINSWFDGIIEYFPKVMGTEQLVDDLEFTIRELNELVYENSRQRNTGIGCTMSLMLVMDWEYWIFHVGDSRIYCLRDMLFNMTQDEVILKHINGRDKTFLVNYIGKDRTLVLNRYHGCANREEIFILGTDGLYKKLIYEDVQVWLEALDCDEAVERFCSQLVTLMIKRGEKDNISCAVLKLSGKEE